ncbi:MAG: hypothetical protein ACFN0X_02860 [Mitsuokella sp.]
MPLVQDAIDAGDSVTVDASDLPLVEDIALANEVLKHVHEKGVLVKAGVGQKRQRK